MPIYVYSCFKCRTLAEVFSKMSEIDDDRPCTKCGTNMERQITAPNINNGTKSSASFEPYRRAFGKSVDNWSSVGDMDKHIAKKNEEYGMNIEPLGSD